ncbi:hypothetical protein CWATWH0003_B004 [Crocosphaera watsonii WH 0003]|uniref:Uncharacterized protein n=1 Tax=Crocosphaera watsonii WH 0003 TaxID=423471 RepID=G5JE17_CROWT|nr:hypothetical protein CWATWH0003_B004 [Crocosphaera watsonii WH 0003]
MFALSLSFNARDSLARKLCFLGNKPLWVRDNEKKPLLIRE